MSLGPSYGYFANTSKTWLIVKSEHLSNATRIFHDSGVSVTTEGKRHLEAALGRKSSIDAYMEEKVVQRVKEVERLSIIAKAHLQAASAVLTHGLSSKWTYLPHANCKYCTTAATATRGCNQTAPSTCSDWQIRLQ